MSAREAGPLETLDRRGGRLVLGFAAVAGLVSGLTLLGYLSGQLWLVQQDRHWQTMSVSTAILEALLSASLAFQGARRPKIARSIGLVALLLSVVILFAQLATGHDVVSPALMSGLGSWPLASETSIATAICTALLAGQSLSWVRHKLRIGLALGVMAISGLAVLGYAYGVRDLYALRVFRTLSLPTAVTLLILAAGFLLADPQAHTQRLVLATDLIGRTTRRQLSFLFIPPVAAFLLLRASSADQLGPGVAMALLVVLTVVPLGFLILRDAAALTRLEAERKAKTQADLAKLAVEQRYRSLFTRLETGFCIIEMAFGPDGGATDYRFLEVNPAFVGQTGLIDAENRWIRDLAPEHEQQWFDIYGRVALTGEPVRFEQQAAALGRFYDVYAFRIDAPEQRRVAILFSDISSRRQAELDLRELNETLEQRVAYRAAELEQAQEALRQSQKLEAIGQLTGGVAHDFNNLLTVIRGSVELLRRPNLSADRRERYVDAIGETADRATTLTSQLLAFARRQALRPELFDVGVSVNDVMGIVTSLIGSRIELKVSVAAEPCMVLTDRSQFDTAIVNMAVNARDAMSGAGVISIACGPVSGIPQLRSHPPVDGDFVAVSIGDTGQGIPAASLASIFEPFFTTKAVGAGTGLGLSQVFGFAKQSGGDIRVDSVEGEGARFILYLPRAAAGATPAPAAAGAADHAAPNVAGDGLCVLVVEDNAQVGAFATHALQELGYESVLAPHAERALSLLCEHDARFNIVFSDVVMPGMTGLEMAEEIRQRYPRLPVILASGYSHVLADKGSPDFELLHKPYSIEQLSKVIAKAVRR